MLKSVQRSQVVALLTVDFFLIIFFGGSSFFGVTAGAGFTAGATEGFEGTSAEADFAASPAAAGGDTTVSAGLGVAGGAITASGKGFTGVAALA